MKKHVLHSILCLFCCIAVAQERFTVKVNAGEDVNSLISNSRYLFPEFKAGTVVFTDNATSKAPLNYDMIMGEMHYVNASGKVMALSDVANISSILFADREFIYTPKGYTEVLTYSGNKALLLHRRIKAEQEKPTGAYGMSSDVSAVESSNAILSTSQRDANNSALVAENVGVALGGGNVTFTLLQTLYLYDGTNLLANASEANFQKIFGKDKKSAIRDYIKKNKINQKKPTDLIQLFNYLANDL